LAHADPGFLLLAVVIVAAVKLVAGHGVTVVEVRRSPTLNRPSRRVLFPEGYDGSMELLGGVGGGGSSRGGWAL
jgi:hypothetical protein